MMELLYLHCLMTQYVVLCNITVLEKTRGFMRDLLSCTESSVCEFVKCWSEWFDSLCLRWE